MVVVVVCSLSLSLLVSKSKKKKKKTYVGLKMCCLSSPALPQLLLLLPLSFFVVWHIEVAWEMLRWWQWALVGWCNECEIVTRCFSKPGVRFPYHCVCAVIKTVFIRRASSIAGVVFFCLLVVTSEKITQRETSHFASRESFRFFRYVVSWCCQLTIVELLLNNSNSQHFHLIHCIL